MMKRRIEPAGCIAAAALALPLASCISVKAPDKPIEINLNVTIRQEVLVRLQRDVEQLINQNPQAFPQTAAEAMRTLAAFVRSALLAASRRRAQTPAVDAARAGGQRRRALRRLSGRRRRRRRPRCAARSRAINIRRRSLYSNLAAQQGCQPAGCRHHRRLPAARPGRGRARPIMLADGMWRRRAAGQAARRSGLLPLSGVAAHAVDYATAPFIKGPRLGGARFPPCFSSLPGPWISAGATHRGDAWQRTKPTRSRSFHQMHGSNRSMSGSTVCSRRKRRRRPRRRPIPIMRVGQLVIELSDRRPARWRIARLGAGQLVRDQALVDVGDAVPRLRRSASWNVIRISKNARGQGSRRRDVRGSSVAAGQDRPDAPVHDRADLVPLHIGNYVQSSPTARCGCWSCSARSRLFMFGGHEAPAGPRPLAGRGRGADRLRRRHGQRQHRARGQEVSAVGLHRLHLHPVRQPDRAACRSAIVPGCASVHVTSQFTLTGVHVADQLRDRARRRLLEARPALLLAVRAARTRRWSARCR